MGRPRTSKDETRSCPICGTPFTVPDWSRKQYCSLDCGRRSKRRPYRRDKTATCTICGQSFSCVRPGTQYCSDKCRGKGSYRKDPRKAHAATRRWVQKEPEQVREYQRTWRKQRRTGILEAFWEAQGGACYLCGDPIDLDGDTKAVHIEHDHSCCPRGIGCAKCRRGIACRTCNRLIGMVDDDPDRLRSIADRLEEAKKAVARRLAEAQPQPSLF